MFAKLTDLNFSTNEISLCFDLFLEVGEYGYAKFVRVNEETQETTVVPFRSFSVSISPNATKQEVATLMQDKITTLLNSLKNVNSKLQTVEQFIGTEIRV